MSVFAIADLHLSFSEDKPMDVFRGWQDYLARLEHNWRAVVGADDVVVLPGDLSWAMKLAHTEADFAFLHSLPGRKVLLKGNHDLWWETARKMTAFFEEKGFNDFTLLHNCAVAAGPVWLCGTRGWPPDAPEDDRVLLREAERLERSLLAAADDGREKIAFLHYPPLLPGRTNTPLTRVLSEHGVRRCYYGHLHGAALAAAVTGRVEGVTYRVVSCDALSFCPLLVQQF